MAQAIPYDFDAAVIELFDSDKIARLKQEWQFLTVEQVALPTADPLFCLGGFPVALARESKGALHGPMFVVRVIRLNGVPEGAENVDTNVDIFCEYATEGEVRQLEKMMPTPKLQGTSGGSLLQYVPNDSAIWSAATTMKLVGIQSSGADTRAWFRVKNWRAILNAFRKHDADLAKFISERLEMDIAHGQGGRATVTRKKVGRSGSRTRKVAGKGNRKRTKRTRTATKVRKTRQAKRKKRAIRNR